MDVKDAVKVAKDYVRTIFEDEHITEVGLEETDFDEKSGEWKITIGFKRPFKTGSTDKKHSSNLAGLPSLLNELSRGHTVYMERWYKLVSIDDKTGSVLNMRDRIIRPAA
jgi:hypothetical protein